MKRKGLQQVVKTAQRIIGTSLPAIEDVQRKRCLRQAHSILKDFSHPAHRLFSPLPLGQVLQKPPDKTQQTKEQLFAPELSPY